MKRRLAALAIIGGLFAGCVATKSPPSFSGPYLGYDESRPFSVDQDAHFSSQRPQGLMKYWTISGVKVADQSILSLPPEKRLFVAEKNGFLYFSTEYRYEHPIWGSSPDGTGSAVMTATYWVYGLDRFMTPSAPAPDPGPRHRRPPPGNTTATRRRS